MEVPEKRMKEAVDALIDDIDKSHLRVLQKQMFLCSSDCYDKAVSREIVESCVERCNKPLKKASKVVQKEMDDLQGQLSRCGMTCYDKAQQKFGPDEEHYTVFQNKEFSEQLSSCISSCVDDHIKLLPDIRRRIVESVQRMKNR